MNMQQARWMILVFLAVALVGYLASRNPALLGQPDEPFSGEVVELRAEAGCEPLGRACAATGEDGGFTLRFSEGVRPLEPFEVRIRPAPGSGIEAQRAMVEFEMTGMDMGINRFRVEPAAGGGFAGQAVIPVCTTGRTDWVATVTLSGTERMWVARFPFEAQSRQR